MGRRAACSFWLAIAAPVTLVVVAFATAAPTAFQSTSLSQGRTSMSVLGAGLQRTECDNGSNAAGCTVPDTTVPLPYGFCVPAGYMCISQIEVGPVDIGGDASCTTHDHGCGTNGTGPIAVGGNASCRVESPNDYTTGCGSSGIGPIAIGGNASCSAYWDGCGSSNGTGPIAVGGNADCDTYSSGCGLAGTGPIAVGGDSSCEVTYKGCGAFEGTGATAIGGNASCSSNYNANCGAFEGTSAISVGGNASCTSNSYGYEHSYACGYGGGTAPIAVGGNATCFTTGEGCGYLGTGPIATGDVSCHGTCGSQAEYFVYVPGIENYGVLLPRSGTPGVAVLGHASCNKQFDAAKATNPSTAVDHAEEFKCVSLKDAVFGP